jgi:hypothetical protein
MEIGCVRNVANVMEGPHSASTVHVVEATSEALVPVSAGGDADERAPAKRARIKHVRQHTLDAAQADKHAPTAAAAVASASDREAPGKVESGELGRQGKLWAGVYKATTDCGAGCCCLHDNATEFTWTENVKNGTVRATMSVAGKVVEGSPAACRGHERMNIRNFIVGKGGNPNVAVKVYCQGSCQVTVVYDICLCACQAHRLHVCVRKSIEDKSNILGANTLGQHMAEGQRERGTDRPQGDRQSAENRQALALAWYILANMQHQEGV